VVALSRRASRECYCFPESWSRGVMFVAYNWGGYPAGSYILLGRSRVGRPA
jgi:hypothetical protein